MSSSRGKQFCVKPTHGSRLVSALGRILPNLSPFPDPTRLDNSLFIHSLCPVHHENGIQKVEGSTPFGSITLIQTPPATVPFLAHGCVAASSASMATRNPRESMLIKS
jgi:hypothetical protein